MKWNKNCLMFLFGAIIINSWVLAQEGLIPNKISPSELSKWSTLDKGKMTAQGDSLIIEEVDGSNGYFIISPQSYEGGFKVRYKVKALSRSTVIINLLKALDYPEGERLTLPLAGATPSEFWDWRKSISHYNLTFNNESHGYTPFFFKNINAQHREFHLRYPEHVMTHGEWCQVEIGHQDNRLWFTLNDRIIFDYEECSYSLTKGHFILRLSGTTGEETILAKAILKDFVIYHE